MSLIAASLLMLAADTGQRTLDYWMVYDGRDIDRESILFVEKSALFQRPDGWINFSFQEVRNGSRLKTFKSRLLSTWVNCKTREFINDYRTEYDRDGAMLQQGKLDEQRRIPAAGSSEAKVLAFACGDTRGATQLAQGANRIAYADALYAQGRPQVAKAPATPAAPAARAPASGRQYDYWLVDDSADSGYEDIVFVDKSSVSRSADGNTKIVYVFVLNGSLLEEDVKTQFVEATANCRTRKFVNRSSQVFGANRKYKGEVVHTEPPAVFPPNSVNGKLLAFACGNTAGATQLQGIDDPIAYADNLYARGRERIASAPAPRTAVTPGRPAETAPGLGRASWKIIALNPVVMTIYTPATVTRGNGTGQAWFTDIYPQPKSLGEVAGVATVQYLYVADCVRNTWRGVQMATYDAHDRLIYSGADPNAQPKAPVSGSIGQLEFNILCGRPVTLFDSDSIENTVPFMREIYATFRAFESLGPAKQ